MTVLEENVKNFFSSSLTPRQNKLDRYVRGKFFQASLIFAVRPELTQEEHASRRPQTVLRLA